MTADSSHAETVLIVDDIPANLNLLRGVLEPEGYRILAATSGRGALGVLRLTRPDLILLDVSMPELDGFETCRQLKQMEEVKSIPVVFVTARHEAEAVVAGFKAGGCDYVTKPFNREEVIVRVKAHLDNTRLQRALEERNLLLEALHRQMEQRQQQLEAALENIKTLRGLLPICSYCHKIRDDQGFWERVENYIQRHSDAEFTHGICPDCAVKYFPDCVHDLPPTLAGPGTNPLPSPSSKAP